MAQGHALTAIPARNGAGASRPRFSEIALRHYIIHPSALPSTLTTSELQRRRSSARLYSRGSSVASSPLTHDRRLPERYGAEPLRSPRTRQTCAEGNGTSPPGNPNITPERTFVPLRTTNIRMPTMLHCALVAQAAIMKSSVIRFFVLRVIS